MAYKLLRGLKLHSGHPDFGHAISVETIAIFFWILLSDSSWAQSAAAHFFTEIQQKTSAGRIGVEKKARGRLADIPGKIVTHWPCTSFCAASTVPRVGSQANMSGRARRQQSPRRADARKCTNAAVDQSSDRLQLGRCRRHSNAPRREGAAYSTGAHRG